MPVSKSRKNAKPRVTHEKRLADKARRYLKEQLSVPLTEEEKEKISAPPWRSLKQCMLGKGTATDWYNLMFRIGSTHELTLAFYEKETSDAMHDVLICLLQVKNLRKPEDPWTYTPAQIQLIDAGLVVADQLGDDATRADQHTAMVKTREYMKQFI